MSVVPEASRICHCGDAGGADRSSTISRRRWPFPVLLIAPCQRREPLDRSLGTIPKDYMNSGAVGKRWIISHLTDQRQCRQIVDSIHSIFQRKYRL